MLLAHERTHQLRCVRADEAGEKFERRPNAGKWSAILAVRLVYFARPTVVFVA
jgi:hypothetical protein